MGRSRKGRRRRPSGRWGGAGASGHLRCGLRPVSRADRCPIPGARSVAAILAATASRPDGGTAAPCRLLGRPTLRYGALRHRHHPASVRHASRQLRCCRGVSLAATVACSAMASHNTAGDRFRPTANHGGRPAGDQERVGGGRIRTRIGRYKGPEMIGVTADAAWCTRKALQRACQTWHPTCPASAENETHCIQRVLHLRGERDCRRQAQTDAVGAQSTTWGR